MSPAGRSRGSLTRRLVGAVGVGALVVVLVIVVLLRSTAALSTVQRATIRSAQVLAQATRLEKLAIDLETGVRGYALTRQRRFLGPYRSARRDVPGAALALRRSVGGDPDQRRDAAAVEGQVTAYIRDYAEPLLAAGLPAPGTPRAVEVTAEGRRRINGIRVRTAELISRERARLAPRSTAADAQASRAQAVGIGAVALLLAMVAGLALYVNRLVVEPVRRLGRGVARLQAGDLSTRVGGPGPAEIADLGAAIDEMAIALQHRTDELERIGASNLARLDTIFAQTPAGLAFLDRERRFVRVNAALAAMTGVAPDDHVGRRPEEISPDAAESGIAVVEQVLATGEVIAGFAVQGRTLASGAAEREWSVTAFPVRDGKAVVGVGLVVIDVTEERQAAQELEAAFAAERAARTRASLLAEASTLLDASLDVEETLASLARLVVPRFADWCAVDLAMPGGRIHNAAVAHVDPDRLALAREYRERYPPSPDAAVGAAAVIRSGKAELIAEITPEVLDAARLEGDRRNIAKELGMVSAMVVPLTARGGTLGAMTLVSSESARRFGDDDFAIAQDLGTRAALALDNARLYRERSEVAQTLQASLLPEALPEIPGVSLAARYEPVSATAEVGGDFYDVFQVGEQRWVVVIGDVCGKGAEAAALTSLARYTLRAVAPLPPEEALRRLNEAILRQRGDLRFITLVYAELDLGCTPPRLTLSSGGHPPPLVIPASGAGRTVECRGTLIGVTPEPQLTTCFVDLAPGDTVALYTDGVTEASYVDPLDGPALIARLDGVERSASGVADGLQRLARAPGECARDDVAILALQLA